MRGIPKRFNTARDIDVCVAMAESGELSKAGVIKKLQAMLNTGQVYVRDKVLDSVDDADGAEPEYRVMQTEAPDGGTEIVQYRLEDNPASSYARIGMDAETIRQYIDRLGGE